MHILWNDSLSHSNFCLEKQMFEQLFRGLVEVGTPAMTNEFLMEVMMPDKLVLNLLYLTFFR